MSRSVSFTQLRTCVGGTEGMDVSSEAILPFPQGWKAELILEIGYRDGSPVLGQSSIQLVTT